MGIQGRQRILLILRYAFLLLVAGIGAGFILGAFRALLLNENEHRWGMWDSVLVIRLIGTLLVCFVVYWRLSKRHPQGYIVNGTVIAALTGALSFLCSLAYAPQVHLFALALSIAFHILIFFVAAALLSVVFQLPATEPDGQQAQQRAAGDARDART